VTAGRGWPTMPDDTTPRMNDPATDAHIPLPGIQTAHDMEEAEEHLLSPDVDLENNELHASGRICARWRDRESARKMMCAAPYAAGTSMRSAVCPEPGSAETAVGRS
jgi:hypothetical protein